MESVLLKANLVILSTGQYWLIFNGEKGMSDREGHGHKAVVYKSHFPPLRHSVVTETPADTLANLWSEWKRGDREAESPLLDPPLRSCLSLIPGNSVQLCFHITIYVLSFGDL